MRYHRTAMQLGENGIAKLRLIASSLLVFLNNYISATRWR